MTNDRDQNEDQARPEGKLYSAGQVAGATFLGSPIAGAWLLAANYHELREPSLRKKALFFGIAATIVIFILAFILPDSFPNSIIPAVYTFGILEVAKRYQGNAYSAHVKAGGLRQSSWRAAGIGLAWLVAILVVLVAVALVLPSEVFPAEPSTEG